jgi:RNA polymerase sigma factor (sigma-70 family)
MAWHFHIDESEHGRRGSRGPKCDAPRCLDVSKFQRLGLNLLVLPGTDHDMPEVSGDSGAPLDLQAILVAHGDRLLRSAYLLCGNHTDAQDLVQETLLQAMKSAARFRGDSAIYTWLHGILVNLNRRRWRKEKRFIHDEDVVLETPCHAHEDTGEDREFRVQRLARAIQALSAEHREVVVLRYYENLKIQEIAAQTGTSVGTIKSRLHYAIRCLEKLVPAELNLFAPDGTHPIIAP